MVPRSQHYVSSFSICYISALELWTKPSSSALSSEPAIGEELQQLNNETCRIMQLAYPGPSLDIMNVVGCDAFLEACGNPSLHIQVLDKAPATMEEVLRIALNLEVLDRLRDAKMKVLVDRATGNSRSEIKKFLPATV